MSCVDGRVLPLLLSCPWRSARQVERTLYRRACTTRERELSDASVNRSREQDVTPSETRCLTSFEKPVEALEGPPGCGRSRTSAAPGHHAEGAEAGRVAQGLRLVHPAARLQSRWRPAPRRPA